MPDRIDPADPAKAYWRLWRGDSPPDLGRFLEQAGPIPPLLLAAVLRVDQRERWGLGERPLAADYLGDFPELGRDPEAALEVLYAEWLLREERGESPALEDYRRNYPELAEDLAVQIEVNLALQRDDGARLSGEGSGMTTDLNSDHDDRGILRDRARIFGGYSLPSISGYEILRELGRGGMGVVYEARQTRLKRVVALKMILAGDLAGAERRARFLKEAEVVARFQHPNIIQIYALGEHNDHPFLELELAENGSLAERLDGTPQAFDSAAALVETLARAIHYAHQQGVVHRDLKPANILLAADGTPKIGDFGLAKLRRHDEDAHAESLTRSGAVLGTPNYMSPEQAGGRARMIGPAADIYALGVILYELLTGRSPFRGATPLETLEQVRTLEPASPRSLRPKLPRDLEVICLKCLEKVPEDRYASAEALADDLGRYSRGEPILGRSPGSWDRLGRLLGPGPSDKEFRDWGRFVLRTTPTVLASHGLIFLLAWSGSPYVHLALIAPLVILLFIQVLLIILFRRRTHGLPASNTRQIATALTSQTLAGIFSLEITRQLVDPSRPHSELAAYPYWSIIAATFYFTLGANHWGRFYLAGIALLILAPLMLLNLFWAPLEFGVTVGVIHASLGIHLREMRREAAGTLVEGDGSAP